MKIGQSYVANNIVCSMQCRTVQNYFNHCPEKTSEQQVSKLKLHDATLLLQLNSICRIDINASRILSTGEV